MKALLICPAERPHVAHLAAGAPLVLAPLLGKSLLEYWLEALAARGATHLIVLASDRPSVVRYFTGDGARWGLRIEVVPQSRELGVFDARTRYRTAEGEWLPGHDVTLLDRLPGLPDLPLFDSYASWFAAVQAFVSHAATPTRIGLREIHPGVWVGLHAQISADAQLHPPCWIGEHAIIGPGAVIGPGAILEDRVVVERGARVLQSIVGPETFVGEMCSLQSSLAHGSTLVNWQTGSHLQVPDAFLLCSLQARPFVRANAGLLGRAAAFAAMAATAPFAAGVMCLSLLRGDPPLQLRLGVRGQDNTRRGTMETFAYYELVGARYWLRRWPQFWSVVRGDLAWFGNRPLRPTQALALTNDFERLWLTTPPGLISLADAHACPDGLSDEACAHASYYAVNRSRRLDWFVLRQCFLRAIRLWPLPGRRRRDTTVPFQQLVPKQQG